MQPRRTGCRCPRRTPAQRWRSSGRRADPERHERPCAGSEDGHQPAVRGDGPEQRADRAAAAALDRPDGRVAATDRPAALGAVEDLVAVMDRLRSPGGCPWDAAQTHASLLPYAVEEVYEVVEAVENDDRTALCEELGDLLLQVVFHARVAQEHQTEPFGLAEVAAGVAAKLRHRHPHVFGDAVVADVEDVHRRWEEIKKAEKARASVLDGIPAGLPALARAQKVLGRARRAGLSVDDGLSLLSASEATGGTDIAGAHGPGDASALGRTLLEIAVAAEAATAISSSVRPRADASPGPWAPAMSVPPVASLALRRESPSSTDSPARRARPRTFCARARAGSPAGMPALARAQK